MLTDKSGIFFIKLQFDTSLNDYIKHKVKSPVCFVKLFSDTILVAYRSGFIKIL